MSLEEMVGAWEGTTRTWLEPGKLADESAIRGSIRRIGTTRFLLHEYEGTYGNDPREGVEIIGMPEAPSTGGVAAWVDTFHMSGDVLLSTATSGGQPEEIVVLASYSDPANPDSERWGWRTHYQLSDADHLTIRAYNIPPGAEAALGTEIVYTRRA